MFKTLLYDDVIMNHINNLSICWGKDRILFRGLAPSRFLFLAQVGTWISNANVVVFLCSIVRREMWLSVLWILEELLTIIV